MRSLKPSTIGIADLNQCPESLGVVDISDDQICPFDLKSVDVPNFLVLLFAGCVS
jgi:hypothetical protein